MPCTLGLENGAALRGLTTHLRAWSRVMPVKTKNLRYSPATSLLKSLLWAGQRDRWSLKGKCQGARWGVPRDLGALDRGDVAVLPTGCIPLPPSQSQPSGFTSCPGAGPHQPS